MDTSNELEQLWLFLSGRAAFLLIYRIVSSPTTDEGELELLRGGSAFGDKIPELAAIYKETALNCLRLGKNGLMPFDTTRRPTPEGRRWRGHVVATGPTRAAGYVIMVMLLAKDEAEMEMYHVGIQRIMQGEEARNVPRPGD